MLFSFFVISGYLMCSILTRKLPLDLQKVNIFYYQRLRRIVPVYLFVISSILLLAVFVFLHPVEYASLFKESLKPLIFRANIPEKTSNYFALVGYIHSLKLTNNMFRTQT
jgi:peptidoglycan/LPS O-acetylase OafA/YrhL